MDQATMMPSQRIGADTHALRGYAPLPGLGVLPVNAYLVQAHEPVLIDTGMAALQGSFMRELRALIDPAELRWIWITHADADHVGNLRAVLAEAPRARIVTNYLGMGKLGLQQLPLDRGHLVNPGQVLDLGDRQLLALRPPVYDAPETVAAFDTRTRHLFSSDCFGAVVDRPYDSTLDIPAAMLADGMRLWSSIDAPWWAQLGHAGVLRAMQAVRALAPHILLSSHLPAARHMTDTLIERLVEARDAASFIGPDPAVLEQRETALVA